MKKIIALGMFASLLNAGLIHAQEATAPSANTNAAAKTNIVAVAGVTAIAGVPAAAATNAAANTNIVAAAGEPAVAVPKPPEDPTKNMIARFSFDAGIMPEFTAGGFAIPVVFQRESPTFLNGQELGAHMPRLVAGKFGQGLLVESAHVNLYSPSQAGAEEVSMFQALNGSALAGTAEKPWEGKQALAVTTKGEAGDEGVALERKVEKALYNGASIVPAYYVASVYLKGQGNLKLFLKDMDSDKPGESVYVDLGNEWKRFYCTFSAPFPAMGIGAKHEADWKKLLPPGTNIEERLQLAIVTTDSSKTTFYADGLQLETRALPYAGTGAGPAPQSWAPGGMVLSNETLTISTKDNYFDRWRTNGTISFWFLPNWDARDGTQDTILQVGKNLMTLQHANGKIHLAPVGAVFTPSDWQNTWHHIAITWNEEGQWVMYMDGLDYPSDEILKRPMAAATALVFGSAAPSTAPNGVIDDLMFFQITLTPEQVKALFAGDLLKPAEMPAPTVTPIAAATPAPASIPAPASTTDVPAAATAPTPTIPAATTLEAAKPAESTKDTEAGE